jgi:hypothetical protein
MPEHRIYSTPFARVYPHDVRTAEAKGRTAGSNRRKMFMKNNIGRFIFAAMLVALVAGYDTLAQAAGDEAAIKQAAQVMQDGWNKKDGKMFASPFAEKHDYININGLYLPNITRDSNARAHQGLFDGPYKEIDLQLRAAWLIAAKRGSAKADEIKPR